MAAGAESRMKRRGLIVVFTGDGQGKTTAALGLALRAAGREMRTVMVQFIKGSWKYGELAGAKMLEPYFTIRPMGRGFVRVGAEEPDEADVRAATEAFEAARECINSGKYDVVILDEINYAVHYRLVSAEEVVALLRGKPEGVHVVLTGRHAPPEVVACADMVTEMLELKHVFRQGEDAVPGIQF